MKFAGWYGIVVGLCMFGQWGLFLATGQVPELQTEPIRLAFHLAAEFATAAMLIIGGVALLGHKSWGVSLYLVAVGMMVYSVIVSPGYFAQQGQWVFVGMFAILLLLAVVSIQSLVRSRQA